MSKLTQKKVCGRCPALEHTATGHKCSLGYPVEERYAAQGSGFEGLSFGAIPLEPCPKHKNARDFERLLSLVIYVSTCSENKESKR